MRKGSRAIFHEYGHYETWHFFPRLPNQERFREHVIATWRESGGEPDGAVGHWRRCFRRTASPFARPDRSCFVCVRQNTCGNGRRPSLKLIFPG